MPIYQLDKSEREMVVVNGVKTVWTWKQTAEAFIAGLTRHCELFLAHGEPNDHCDNCRESICYGQKCIFVYAKNPMKESGRETFLFCGEVCRAIYESNLRRHLQ